MREPVKIEPSPKRVRVMLGGEMVVDSYRPLLVWEVPYFPTYFFPRTDVNADLLPDGEREGKGLGSATTFTVKTPKREAKSGAYSYLNVPELTDLIALRWKSMDSWFEEDEEVYVHPRDPYKRVDILKSTRHVQVLVDGVEVANSMAPTLLFETSLPTRYYLPKTDVRMGLLTKSDRHTECPYKGVAEYWDLTVNGQTHPNFVWSYPFPTSESSKIAGLLCFYNERVDLIVDGLALERPASPFS